MLILVRGQSSVALFLHGVRLQRLAVSQSAPQCDVSAVLWLSNEPYAPSAISLVVSEDTQVKHVSPKNDTHLGPE